MVENVWVDTTPDYYPGNSAGVLCIHGLSGTPAEMRPLAKHLSALGYTVDNMLLPGHGAGANLDEHVGWQDWVDAAAEHIDRLQDNVESTTIIGLSTGSLIALALTERFKIDRFVLLAPAIEIDSKAFKFIPFARHFLPSVSEIPRPNAGLTKRGAWKKLWHHERRTLDSLNELISLQRYMRKRFKNVDVPTLIFQGKKDQTVVPRGAKKLDEQLPESTLKWLDDSGHCLPMDVDAPEMFSNIVSFLDG